MTTLIKDSRRIEPKIHSWQISTCWRSQEIPLKETKRT